MIDETKIMQLADGTLPMEERAEVEAAIKKDPKLQKLFEDLIAKSSRSKF